MSDCRLLLFDGRRPPADSVSDNDWIPSSRDAYSATPSLLPGELLSCFAICSLLLGRKRTVMKRTEGYTRIAVAVVNLGSLL